MTNAPERKVGERFPIWIPDKVGRVLSKTLAKEPIDLMLSNAVGKHFMNRGEIDDVFDIIRKVKDPVLIGLYGSRASLHHPPLFAGVEDFDLYHDEALQVEGTFEEYLVSRGVTLSDYQDARNYLQHGRFNEGYKQGKLYPEPIVHLLVRDIDLLIIAGGVQQVRGRITGRRTNISIDLNIAIPQSEFELDTPDYLELGVAQTIPFKY